jgi:hypothetical protein
MKYVKCDLNQSIYLQSSIIVQDMLQDVIDTSFLLHIALFA